MNDDYTTDLELLKSTFDPQSESSIISELIGSSSPGNQLTVLDVGIGEGKTTFKAIEELRIKGFDTRLTALDIYISEHLRSSAIKGTTLIEEPFSNYQTTKRFDVVLATQSIYYLGNVDESLARLISYTNPEGWLIVTAWCENCALFKLHKQFGGVPTAQSLTAETIMTKLSEMDNDADVRMIRRIGKVELEKWLESENISLAAFNILSRVAQSIDFDLSRYELFKREIQSLPKLAQRENGTVVFRPSQKTIVG